MTKDNPINTSNEYVGIFGCDSASYASEMITGGKWLFAMEGPGNTWGYSAAAERILCSILGNADPKSLARLGTEALMEKLGSEWEINKERIIWYLR